MRKGIAGCVLAAMSLTGCGADTRPEPRDPVAAVREFYDALYLDQDAERACKLLLPAAQVALTTERPAPPCSEAATSIGEGVSDAQREEIERGLQELCALGVAQRTRSKAEIELASSDTSPAGLMVRRIGTKWRIEGLDSGAVDGGQPSAQAAAIRSLHRWRIGGGAVNSVGSNNPAC